MILPSLTQASTRAKECDDQSALRSLIENIEMLRPIAAAQDRDSEEKSRILLNAVANEAPTFTRGV